MRILPGRRTLRAALILGVTLLSGTPRPARSDDLAAARALYLRGDYPSARAAYARLGPRTDAAIGLARCDAAVGERDGATRILRGAIAADPRSASAHAELAALLFERGDHPGAQAQVDSALVLDPDQPAAHYFAAELHRVAGRMEDANQGYLWFVRFYNREQEHLQDPEVLRWVGLAGAQNARWNHNSGQFGFLVHTLYPDALKADSLYWPAHLDEALLFIEKYNPRDALDEIEAGLRINPNAAELHAARALIALQRFDLDSARVALDRALALQPRLTVAHRLRADLQLLASGPREALPLLEPARALNPVDEETLGRIAGAEAAIDGFRNGTSSPRVERLIAEAIARNPHCGAFFAAMAGSLDLLARFPDAARLYEQARARMPQLVSVPGQLGLVYMKLGEEDRARTLLHEAFEADPFNQRVKNSMDVLELLQGYGTLETPHFVIRFDPARDSALARQAAQVLEQSIHPEIVAALGYAPRAKTQIEIFARGKGSGGHAWFSMRVAGLPFIGTIGASTGSIIALTTPREAPGEADWAHVLRHEFVHVVNIQQTGFSMPRWYTEGLAVRLEGSPRPAIWDTVLVHRAAEHRLFDLDTIQLGFLRPNTGADWILAYYQAQLYIEYIAERYGKDGPAKMIAAYGSRLDTHAALKQCFGVEPAEFEKGYRAYIDAAASRAAGLR